MTRCRVPGCGLSGAKSSCSGADSTLSTCRRTGQPRTTPCSGHSVSVLGSRPTFYCERAEKLILVFVVTVRRIDMGRDGARCGVDPSAGTALRLQGSQKGGVHAAVDAGCSRHVRNATDDQFGSLNV